MTQLTKKQAVHLLNSYPSDTTFHTRLEHPYGSWSYVETYYTQQNEPVIQIHREADRARVYDIRQGYYTGCEVSQ